MRGSTIAYITIYCILGPSLPSGNPFNSSATSYAISHTPRGAKAPANSVR